MLISYSLLQPKLNSRWGWNLPSLASLLSENSSSGEPERGSGSPSDSLGEENLRYGLLRGTKRQEFVSPAGLRYTRGSEEGHRLDHLARHLEDQPERPGRWSFRGDMHRVLLWLDEAYQRNQIGAHWVASLALKMVVPSLKSPFPRRLVTLVDEKAGEDIPNRSG